MMRMGVLISDGAQTFRRSSLLILIGSPLVINFLFSSSILRFY